MGKGRSQYESPFGRLPPWECSPKAKKRGAARIAKGVEPASGDFGQAARTLLLMINVDAKARSLGFVPDRFCSTDAAESRGRVSVPARLGVEPPVAGLAELLANLEEASPGAGRESLMRGFAAWLGAGLDGGGMLFFSEAPGGFGISGPVSLEKGALPVLRCSGFNLTISGKTAWTIRFGLLSPEEVERRLLDADVPAAEAPARKRRL